MSDAAVFSAGVVAGVDVREALHDGHEVIHFFVAVHAAAEAVG
jgi:hypothetical protein